jgi:hypothetical protein
MHLKPGSTDLISSSRWITGNGSEDPLNLVVEIKGYRGEDAKEKNPPWIPTGCRVSII